MIWAKSAGGPGGISMIGGGQQCTISTFELFAMFPDRDTARVYLERRLWPDGPEQ